MEDNKYYQLVEDLESGALPMSLVCRAIRTYVENNENIPEGARNLLSSSEGGGYIAAQFQVMQDVIGKVELAYRRGKADR